MTLYYCGVKLFEQHKKYALQFGEKKEFQNQNLCTSLTPKMCVCSCSTDSNRIS